MTTIPPATTITLTTEKQSVLEAVNRSTKTEVRLRDRASMVLLATGGTATRDIGRLVGHTTHSRRHGLSPTKGQAVTTRYTPRDTGSANGPV
jgi:hypothetical protein